MPKYQAVLTLNLILGEVEADNKDDAEIKAEEKFTPAEISVNLTARGSSHEIKSWGVKCNLL